MVTLAEKVARYLPTERQADVLASILRLANESGRTPSILEIGKECGIKSTNGVVCHLTALKRKGCINWIPNASRSLVVNRTIPILGECS